MKAQLRSVNDHGVVYNSLVFVCPGCAAGGPDGYSGLHSLPVNAENIGKPVWTWNGDLEKPTLSPSILTHGTKNGIYPRCHSYLQEGKFNFLTDSTHPLAGQNGIPMPDLPEWAEKLDEGEDDGD